MCVCGGGEASANLESLLCWGMHPHPRSKLKLPCSTLEMAPRQGQGLGAGRV